MESSSFISNTAATGSGGGLYNAAAGTLTNTTFAGNSAGSGGAIHSTGDLRLINSSLANNSALSSTALLAASNQATQGGAIAGYNVTLTNTLLAHNVTGGNCAGTGGVVIDGGHNLEDANTCGFNSGSSLTNTNPSLGAAGYYGGAVPTLLLLINSPAIDRADDAACPATDARGIARPIGAHCDIGVYEAFNRFLWLPVIRH
jgi:predicted outer membrane repeat protein